MQVMAVTLAEQIAVMQAALEGKPIERCGVLNEWIPDESQLFDWTMFDYRVAETSDFIDWQDSLVTRPDHKEAGQ